MRNCGHGGLVQLFEAQLGLHSKGYHEARKAQAEEEEEVGLLGQARPGFQVRGGVVNLPSLYYYGVEGGIYGTARLEGTSNFGVDTPLYVQLRLMWNDPEMLALYPYAYNGVWFSYRIWSAF